MNQYSYETKIGKMSFTEENGKIIEIGIHSISYYPENQKETPMIKEAHKQIEEYLQGKRKEFTFPIEVHGTTFQEKVWEELCKIPYGQTVSYGEIAKRVNSPKAARAVGMANHVNRVMIAIPCHRVIRS